MDEIFEFFGFTDPAAGAIILGAIFLGIPLAILACWFFIGSNKQCPKCKKLYAEELKSSGPTSKRQETITKYDITRNTKGEEISRTEREEQGTIVDRQSHYQCKFCKFEWSKSYSLPE